MEANIYQPPVADLQAEPTTATSEFYVVSKTKFLVLMVATAGLYDYYWCYKNWSLYKKASGETMWPFMRAIFAIFFMHSLLRKIDYRVRETSPDFRWHPLLLANIYVVTNIVCGIASQVGARVPQYAILSLASFVVIPITMLVFYRTQLAANTACGDTAGTGNARFTAANIAWILIGALYWVIMAVGIGVLV